MLWGYRTFYKLQKKESKSNTISRSKKRCDNDKTWATQSQLSFHFFRGYLVASQFTTPPNRSPSLASASTSVASNKLFNESCTSAAFSNFFSNDGKACFFGGGTCNSDEHVSKTYDIVDYVIIHTYRSSQIRMFWWERREIIRK